MSLAQAAARGKDSSRRRMLGAVLAVSLVLNVLFVAGALWSRVEETPRPGLDQRFEAIGAQLDLDARQRIVFDELLAQLRGRSDRIQQQVVPLYRAAWDAAGNPAADPDEVLRLFDAAFAKRHELSRETMRKTLDFLATLSPEQRSRFVARARERANWRK